MLHSNIDMKGNRPITYLQKLKAFSTAPTTQCSQWRLCLVWWVAPAGSYSTQLRGGSDPLLLFDHSRPPPEQGDRWGQSF